MVLKVETYPYDLAYIETIFQNEEEE